jgi:nucleoid DNA-binding protein
MPDGKPLTIGPDLQEHRQWVETCCAVLTALMGQHGIMELSLGGRDTLLICRPQSLFENLSITGDEKYQLAMRTFDVAREHVVRGESVRIPGWGTFMQKHRSARTGRNPRTQEPMQIAESTYVGFRPSRRNKDLGSSSSQASDD